MYTIAKQFSFCASHQLVDLVDGHPCMRLHGHNYVVEIQIEAERLGSDGFVLDYHELKPVKEYLDKNFDHNHLNFVMNKQPSAEYIAREIYLAASELLDVPLLGRGRIIAVRVSETPKTWAEYRP